MNELTEPGTEPCDFVTGTAVIEGELHARLSIGCQDAPYTVNKGALMVGVVCDGCSSTEKGFTRNHVGAVLGAQFISATLAEQLRAFDGRAGSVVNQVLHNTTYRTYGLFRRLCRTMGLTPYSEDWKEFIHDKLMFTVIGFIAVREHYWVFGLGDGCYGVNDTIVEVNPPERPYMNQWLLEERNSRRQAWEVHAEGQLSEIDALWVGSDGLMKVLSSPSATESFRTFLSDEYIGQHDSRGNDRTVQALRRTLYRRHRDSFTDDVAVALLRRKSVQTHLNTQGTGVEG